MDNQFSGEIYPLVTHVFILYFFDLYVYRLFLLFLQNRVILPHSDYPTLHIQISFVILLTLNIFTFLNFGAFTRLVISTNLFNVSIQTSAKLFRLAKLGILVILANQINSSFSSPVSVLTNEISSNLDILKSFSWRKVLKSLKTVKSIFELSHHRIDKSLISICFKKDKSLFLTALNSNFLN